MKYLVLPLLVFASIAQAASPAPPRGPNGEIRYNHNPHGTSGGSGPIGVGGGPYGSWNYPPDSYGYEDRPPASTPPSSTPQPTTITLTQDQAIQRAINLPPTAKSQLCRKLFGMDNEERCRDWSLPVVEERGRDTGFDYTQQRHRSPSPSLEQSYPELSVLPVLHRLALPIAESIVQIGVALDRYRDSHDYPRIDTPYGPAEQDTSQEALALRELVESGSTIYRIGTRRNTLLTNGTRHRGSNTGDSAQFWATENPNNPGFTDRYGIPEENISEINFIERATMRPGSTFVVRRAPGVGNNEGGAYEVVIPEAEGSIEMRDHSSY